ncbi:MAG: alkaline phosphatase family protein [Isosphaeraceae bacterium]|nr:alkaline phosphatase family protein [Isosphaeraceae bacterium]
MMTTCRLMILFIASFVCATERVPAAERHVVVISVDGLPHYLFDDQNTSMPNLRRLAAEGVRTRAGMIATDPTITWPNHTSLMTGVKADRHGVLYNGALEWSKDRSLPVRVEPDKTQAQLVRVPLLFDVLAEKGMTSAAINWPCTAGSKSIADNLPDAPRALAQTTPRLREELERSGDARRFEAGNIVVKDEIWAAAACRILAERKPSLTCLHLLNVDSTHHKHGPRTVPGATAVALADALIGDVLRTIDAAGLRDSTTVFVVSDHGFAGIPQSINANLILRDAGYLEVLDDKITKARAQVVREGGIGQVYFAHDLPDADRAAIKRLLEKAEGVDRVLEPGDYSRYHLPLPTADRNMGDLVIAAKEGYDVDSTLTGSAHVSRNDAGAGAHGFLSSLPNMRATFVAWGAGIARGRTIDEIDNIDLAPTIAHILGTSLPNAVGRARTDILAD